MCCHDEHASKGHCCCADGAEARKTEHVACRCKGHEQPGRMTQREEGETK
jgi:hypothetical protein